MVARRCVFSGRSTPFLSNKIGLRPISCLVQEPSIPGPSRCRYIGHRPLVLTARDYGTLSSLLLLYHLFIRYIYQPCRPALYPQSHPRPTCRTAHEANVTLVFFANPLQLQLLFSKHVSNSRSQHAFRQLATITKGGTSRHPITGSTTTRSPPTPILEQPRASEVAVIASLPSSQLCVVPALQPGGDAGDRPKQPQHSILAPDLQEPTVRSSETDVRLPAATAIQHQ